MDEQIQRQQESLNLWEPLPEQERFHASTASERIVRGGWRSGKTLCACIELARAALGRDPYNKYPNRKLTIWIICWEESNIGRTIYRLLFQPGAFKIIKDAETGRLRAYRPWDAADKARKTEAVDAPPLIPQRYYNVRNWAWKDKARRIFAIARLHNGTEIFTFNSGGDPPTGDDVDFVLIDEDLQYGEHLKELEARLSGREGRLVWSAKPRSRNEALLDICERARQQTTWPEPDVAEFQLVFSRNPHIDEEQKRKRMDGWTPEERAALDYGEFNNATVLFYPNFNIEIQGVPENADPYGRPLAEQPHEIDRLLIKKQIPPDWTRYMVVDPGQQVCFVLFAAVPPRHLGDYVVAYDELYLMNCDPVKFGKSVADRAGSQHFHAFIIDEHGGRQRTAGVIGSKTVKQQYSDQLRKHGVCSQVTNYSFLAGNDDISGGTNLVKGMLNLREDGTCRFRVLRGACPHLERSLSRYRKKIIQGVVTDEPARGDNHGADCVRYLLCYNPKWHPHRVVAKQPTPQYLFFKRIADEARKRGRDDYIHLGPGRN